MTSAPSRSLHSRVEKIAHPVLNVLIAVVVCLSAVGMVRRSREQSHSSYSSLPIRADKTATLVLLFQNRDCASYQPFITDWRQFVQRGKFDVIGIRIDGSSQEGGTPFKVPYHLVPHGSRIANRMIRELHILNTPAAVLLNSAGQPVMVLRARDIDLTQRDLGRIVGEFASTLARPS